MTSSCVESRHLSPSATDGASHNCIRPARSPRRRVAQSLLHRRRQGRLPQHVVSGSIDRTSWSTVIPCFFPWTGNHVRVTICLPYGCCTFPTTLISRSIESACSLHVITCGHSLGQLGVMASPNGTLSELMAIRLGNSKAGPDLWSGRCLSSRPTRPSLPFRASPGRRCKPTHSTHGRNELDRPFLASTEAADYTQRQPERVRSWMALTRECVF